MMRTSLKASLIAVAIASIPCASQAAGLGQISVYSGLGQPLRAEIPISATPQELQSLSARIASPDAFRQANVAYSATMTSVRVTIDANSQRPVIRLSSDRPINDPFVDLLLEFDWPSGRLVREYTFLLDPVDIGSPRPLAAQVEPARAVPAERGTPAAAPASALATQSAGAGQSAPAPTRSASDTHTVQRGDTLRRIAEANRPQGASLDQTLVALFRANRSAFDGENMNRLRAGVILSIPSAEAVEAVDSTEARREVLAQAADFNAYRRRLAGAAVTRAAEEPAPAEQASAGRIVPKVEESQPQDNGGDQVKVSATDKSEPGAAQANAGEANSRLQALEEELVTREKALNEANSRLAELERNIQELQKLVEMKSQTMAQLQGQSSTPAAESQPAAPAPLPAAEAAPAPAQNAAPAPEQAAPTPAAEPAAAAPAAEPAPAPATQPAAEEPPKPAPKPRRPAPPPPPPPEPSFVDTLLGDPTLLAAGGGILALLLGYGGYRLRQQRQAKAAAATDSSVLISEFPPDSSAVFGSTGGQSVDTGNSSLLQTDFSQSGLSSIDADEGVDPVAEADVYMAYGRDAQAEEILLDALKADPTRAAVSLKLLEIYAKRQSVQQFETTASEFYARTGGEGADWEKAAQMGRELDPENPLYRAASGKASAPAAEDSAASLAAGAAVAAGLAATAEAEEETAPSLATLDFTSSMPVTPAPSASQLKNTWTMPGDLNQLAQGDVEPVLEVPAATEEIPPALDVSTIDFDLDLGDMAPPIPTEAETPAAESDSTAESATSTDPGFVFEEPVTEQPTLAATDLVFDLELDAGDEPAAAQGSGGVVDSSQVATDDAMVTMLGDAPQPAAEEESQLVAEAAAPAFDMSATVLQTEPLDAENEDEAVLDLEKTSFDSSLLDFEFNLESSTPSATSEAANFDLTRIDLDLDPAAAAGEGDAGLDNEVETKLELARAYDEMGDKEGARELLEEVVREGSAAQQAAARELIAKLG